MSEFYKEGFVSASAHYEPTVVDSEGHKFAVDIQRERRQSETNCISTRLCGMGVEGWRKPPLCEQVTWSDSDDIALVSGTRIDSWHQRHLLALVSPTLNCSGKCLCSQCKGNPEAMQEHSYTTLGPQIVGIEMTTISGSGTRRAKSASGRTCCPRLRAAPRLVGRGD